MRRFLLLTAFTSVVIGMLAAPALAEIEGPCDAYFNGIHFDDLDTPEEAKASLVIQPGETLNLSGAIYGDIDALRVDVVFRPFTVTLADEYEPDSNADGTETFNIDLPIEFLAQYGSGIYEFQGSTDICSGNAFFILGGVDVQDTLIGQVALGTVGLGGIIGLTSWIPTLFTGRVGWGRDIFGGILIGIGAAVVAQQAGEVPLGAMSVGVGVGGGIVGSILIDKVCGGINGIFSGGGSAMPTPPATPPPAPPIQSFPDTFQPDVKPDFSRSADTFHGAQPDFTQSADTFRGAQPDIVKADPADAFGGSPPAGQPDVTPDFTRSADTFQGAQPEFTESADTFQGAQPDIVKPDPADAFGGSSPAGQPDATPDFTRSADTFQPDVEPDFTRSADTFQGAQPDTVKADPVDAFGGSSPSPQAPSTPEMTSIQDTFEVPSPDPASAGSGGSASTSAPTEAAPGTGGGAQSPGPAGASPPGGAPPSSAAPTQAPSGGGATPSGGTPTQAAPTGPGSGAAPQGPATAGPGGGATSPGGSPAPQATPSGQASPPDLTAGQSAAPQAPASTGGGSGAPAGQATPPDLTAQQAAGEASAGSGSGSPSSGAPAGANAPPSGAIPTPSGVTPGGGGLPIAAVAGVAGPVAMASLAKAVTKRKQGRATAAAAYWFYVEAATPVFSIEDHTRQVAELRPGSWYLARAEYDEWVHMKDDDSGAEGWVPGWAAKRQG